MLPFDLHVLGMPPAFNLSQDQTLQFNPLYSLSLRFSKYFQSTHTVCLLFFLISFDPKSVMRILLINLPLSTNFFIFFDFLFSVLILRFDVYQLELELADLSQFLFPHPLFFHHLL